MKRRPRKAGAMPPEVREEVLVRDRWRCQAPYLGFRADLPCFGALHVHHAVLRSQGGRDHPDDLLTLCMMHHNSAHVYDRALAEETGVIRRRSDTAAGRSE